MGSQCAERDRESMTLPTQARSMECKGTHEVIEIRPVNKVNKVPQILAALVATFGGGFITGNALAWTSPVLPHIADCQEDCDFQFDDITGSWIGGVLSLGALVSAFLGGYMMNKQGPKRTMLFMAIPLSLGNILLLLPYPLDFADIPSKWLFIVGRIFVGFYVGSASLVTPVYSTEISETSIRGILGSFYAFGCASGALLNNVLGSFMHWYDLTLLISLIPVILSALLLMMPESPVFLLAKGKEKGARKSLQWLRGIEYDVSEEIKQMEINIQQKSKLGMVTLKELFTKQEYLKPTLIMLVLMVCRQMTGVNYATFYLNEIFIKADTGFSSELQSSIASGIAVIAVGLSLILVERFGRRILLLSSATICCISMTLLGVYFYLEENMCLESEESCSTGLPESTVRSLSWIPLVALNIYFIGFNIGLGPLPWALNGEMFSEEAKSKSSALSTATNWTTTFLVTKFSTNLSKVINNSGVYLVFASVSLFCAIFTALVVPETKGKSPEDMKAYFMPKKNETKMLKSQDV